MTRIRRRLLFAGLALVAGFGAFLYLRFALPLVPKYGKGGVGNAGRGAFVFTKEDTNSMRCGSSEWHGRSRQQTETITCGPFGTLSFKFSMLADTPLIIHFEPDRIYIFDMDTFGGGYYLRDYDIPE